MGLSIHYSGTLKDMQLLPALIAEVQDICTILQWPFSAIDAEGLTGIHFTPPECETIGLTFTPDGKLTCFVKRIYGVGLDHIISVKTQFAGAEIHKALIRLFRHLSHTYFSHFEMQDESGYWETGDETVLYKSFARYNFLLDTVATALQDFNTGEDDTEENLVERLEKFFRERLR